MFKLCASVVVLVAAILFVLLNNRQREVLLSSPGSELDMQTLRSGDLLFFMSKTGLSSSWGHLALIVRIPRYGQLFAFDIVNPFRTAPDILKPLPRFFEHCAKHRGSMMFIQRLEEGPDIDPRPVIRSLSAAAHFDVGIAYSWSNKFCRDKLKLPGLPPLRNSGDIDLYYCATFVVTVLQRLGVLKESLLQNRDILLPTDFFTPQFDINQHTNAPWRFGALRRTTALV